MQLPMHHPMLRMFLTLPTSRMWRLWMPVPHPVRPLRRRLTPRGRLRMGVSCLKPCWRPHA